MVVSYFCTSTIPFIDNTTNTSMQVLPGVPVRLIDESTFCCPMGVDWARASHQQRHVFGPPVPPVGRVDWRGPALDVDVGEVSYVESYNTMLADHAWHADWEGALETLQDMRSLTSDT